MLALSLRLPTPMQHILVDIPTQTLTLYDTHDTVEMRFAIASSRYGCGQQRGSYQTPLGKHTIRAKIGADMPCYTVFRGRRPTGECWSPALHTQYPERDWILTRILWLCGCEAGFNRHGAVDTMQRYIYIHGTPDCVPLGVPSSIGCIRMHSHDLIQLFERVPLYTPVLIQNSQPSEGA